MATRNSKYDQKLVIGIDAVLSGTTPGTSANIDTIDANDVVMYVFTGTITDAGTSAGITWALQESDVADSGYTAVDSSEIIGSLADLSILEDTDDNKVMGSIGYVGKKRYLRLIPTGTTGTDGAVKVVVIMNRLSLSTNLA